MSKHLSSNSSSSLPRAKAQPQHEANTTSPSTNRTPFQYIPPSRSAPAYITTYQSTTHLTSTLLTSIAPQDAQRTSLVALETLIIEQYLKGPDSKHHARFKSPIYPRLPSSVVIEPACKDL